MTERPEDMIFDQSLRLIDRNWTLSADRKDDSWPETLWNTISEAGFLDLLVPAEQGGTEASPAEAAAFLKAAGARAVPLPIAETIVARRIMAQLGLPLPDPQRPIGLVISSSDGSIGASPERHPAPWARQADIVIVLHLQDGAVKGRVAGKGEWTIAEAGVNLAGQPTNWVEIAPATELRDLDDRAPISSAALFALLRAAQIAGAMGRVLEISTNYAQERVQFGRPIGKFQAIQQMAAELAAHVAASQAAVDAATTHLAAGDVLAWSAKARGSEACGRVAAIAHQMVGALGYTREFALHHFTRLLWAWREDAGDESFWQSQLADAILRQDGRGDFWTFLTDYGSRSMASTPVAPSQNSDR